jgi:putative transposase
MPPFDPEIHHRRSIRLKGYDYAQAGAYYITIACQNHESLFGKIVDGTVLHNDAGKMVESWWLELPHKFSSIEADEFIIMPDHFHGIIVINEHVRAAPLSPGALGVRPGGTQTPDSHTALPQIIQWFKTMATNAYIRGVKQSGWTPFFGKLWQRGYYEHIIRNELDLNRVREYILNNPIACESANSEYQG